MRMTPRSAQPDRPDRGRRPSPAAFYPADPGELARLVDDLLGAAVRPPDVTAADADPACSPASSCRTPGWSTAARSRPSPGGSRRRRRLPARRATQTAAGTTTTSCCSARTIGRVARRRRGLGRAAPGERRSVTSRWTRTLAAEILALRSPFLVDRDAHRSEHSIEVQLPFIAGRCPAPGSCPLADRDGHGATAAESPRAIAWVPCSRSARARGAQDHPGDQHGHGALPAGRASAARVTEDAGAVHPRAGSGGPGRREAEIAAPAVPGVVCGMCGIEPTVRRARRAPRDGRRARCPPGGRDVRRRGGPSDRTVGYLAVAFPG